MTQPDTSTLNRAMHAPLPPHLTGWQLPPDWRWGVESVWGEHRHYQEVIDGLDRSLSLVTAPDPAHAAWLAAEARHLGHRIHPSIPTTYHYWARYPGAERGPGYLRRWISGETIRARFDRTGTDDFAYVLQLLRSVGSALAYLHSAGTVHGAISSSTIWATPTGQFWLLGWEWAMPKGEIPPGLAPDLALTPAAPEMRGREWAPTQASDQWQVAATCFATLAGEYPPPAAPPLALLSPECPQSVAAVLDRALLPDPDARFNSMAALLRALDHAVGSRTSIFVSGSTPGARAIDESEEARLRWATGEDYEVLARLGAGTFGSVWRVRDLTLEREVALKMLHPHISRDDEAVRRFRREAQLAAQLAHPAIVPIFDWDSNGGVTWYTMELAEGGSLADLVARSGRRSLAEVAPQIEHVLDGLAAAHSSGIIHRDLKPENILIDRYRRWRIADFGVARIPGEELFGGTTGTPEFSAPEQLLDEAQGPAADLFGVAGIVVFLLSGRPPFGSGDGRTILARQLSGDMDLSLYPPAIAEWLRRGLMPQPERRFADATAMRHAWRRAVESTLEHESRASWWRRWFSGEEMDTAV
ncbi:MAG TPA: serine/threonine-protein kinase [Gemmatimonadaceae bacterium]|nr:serine/threonine-protein kinase [Gemmatimonadaceae bacterium]